MRKIPFTLGNNVHLQCAPLSNLASVVWKFNGSRIQAKASRYLLYDGGMAILNVTADVAGFYDCLSVEKSKGKEFLVTVARYALYARQKPEEANIATANKHKETEAVGFQSSVPAPSLKEAAKQESADSQRLKLILKLGAGLAPLIFILLVLSFHKSHLYLSWKSRETSPNPASRAGSGSPVLAAEGLGCERKCSDTQTGRP